MTNGLLVRRIREYGRSALQCSKGCQGAVAVPPKGTRTHDAPIARRNRVHRSSAGDTARRWWRAGHPEPRAARHRIQSGNSRRRIVCVPRRGLRRGNAAWPLDIHRICARRFSGGGEQVGACECRHARSGRVLLSVLRTASHTGARSGKNRLRGAISEGPLVREGRDLAGEYDAPTQRQSVSRIRSSAV